MVQPGSGALPRLHSSLLLRLQPHDKACDDSGASSSFLPCYKMGSAADAGTAGAILLGILLCSVPQGASAALALLITGGRHNQIYQALAFVALATGVANCWMYGKLLDLACVNAPGSLFLALDTAGIFAAAVMEMLGLLALLGARGEDQGKQASKA